MGLSTKPVTVSCHSGTSAEGEFTKPAAGVETNTVEASTEIISAVAMRKILFIWVVRLAADKDKK
jgi:hypothetical protein